MNAQDPTAETGGRELHCEALRGLRVLDLSRILAGPWCTQLLGDLGAEIVKVERPGRGDDTRAWGPPFAGPASDGLSAYFLSANRNKRSVAVDFSRPDGAALLRGLATRSDVVVENFRPGTLERYGLGYERLRSEKPDLVYCSITGFGAAGPESGRPGYDLLIQAMGGLMSVTGEADGPPLKAGVALADVVTDLYAANGILAALRSRDATGEGQRIDIALLDTQVAALANQALNYLVSGDTPGRAGNAHPNIVPYQTFPAADGYLVLAIGNDAQFRSFCTAAGIAGLAEDPRFATNSARVEHRHELLARLEPLLASRPRDAWLALLGPRGVPCGPVRDIAETFADARAQENPLDFRVAAEAGPLPQVANPLHLSGTPPHYRRPPPRLGSDTAAVLRELLGLGDPKLESLAAAGIIGLPQGGMPDSPGQQS